MQLAVSLQVRIFFEVAECCCRSVGLSFLELVKHRKGVVSLRLELKHVDRMSTENDERYLLFILVLFTKGNSRFFIFLSKSNSQSES